ncbi:MAG: trypsin-like peptidase domain-containing protein [Burkholderiaceae bacterium]|jgi:serine protease DegQ|nr:trypsin-like peptidase domain-containing protein [Burkholderiaceae bacterium]
MFKRLWLLFAQVVTTGLAVWFIVTALKPEWTDGSASQTKPLTSTVTVQEAASGAGTAKPSYREAVGRAMPSVVNIFTTKEVRLPQNPLLDDPLFKNLFGDRLNERGGTNKQTSLGSGVIVSAEGYIVTNNHVVETADQIEVALESGEKATAKLVGTDPETDLAVIKVDLPKLHPITLGRIEDVKVGDVVLAIGNPFGLQHTVTMGIVSALGRSHLGVNIYENFIQTDAAINQGNSGGALVDAQGNLLGINSVIFSSRSGGGSLGIGFAIPVSMVKTIMEALINKGKVVRGWLGVEVRDVTPEIASKLNLNRKDGVIIGAIVKNGPADKAGLKPGDILLSVDDKPIRSMKEMFALIASLQPGQKAGVSILRNGHETLFSVTAGERPPAGKRGR